MSKPRHFKFCPHDGAKLQATKGTKGRHPFCSVCGFVDYRNPVACVAILIVRDGQILLARRGVAPAKGEWDIPGGFLEAGESAEKAVVREASEETTLRVRVREFLGSLPDIYGARNTPTLNLIYWVEVTGGSPKAKSDVASLRWFDLMADRLPKMAFAHQKRAIGLLQSRLAP